MYISFSLCSDSGNYTYQLAVSENLGRSTHKERYAYIYRYRQSIQVKYFTTLCISRNETVEVLQTYQYDDLNDSFEREPFSVMIRSRACRQESQYTYTVFAEISTI